MISSPTAAPQRRSLMKKQIPTLLGLMVLIAGLAIGAYLFSSGTGIFLPRATPETTPKSIRISNVTDQGFSVSFMTDAATSGFIRYGVDPKKLTQIGDQRDQLTGSVGEYALHHISVLRGLEPNTTYYYVLGTGKGALFDDNGEPFTIKTAKQAGTQPKALTVFGSAESATGSPAAGAIVFVTPPDAGTLSSLVTSTGSWAVSLSTARTKDGSDYAKVSLGDDLAVQVMAIDPKDNTQLTAKVEAETAIAIKLGSTQPITPSPALATEATPQSQLPTPSPFGTGSGDMAGLLNESDKLSPAAPGSGSGGLAALTTGGGDAEEIITVVELTAAEPASGSTPPVVEVTTPIITGVAEPNVTITIKVNSQTQLDAEVVADENGNFELDISQYEQELEPGEHTITYSYVHPSTGETITQTRTFTVAPRVMLATAATPTPKPFSSSNPYPISTSSATGTTSATPTMTPYPTATSSGLNSTRSANVGTGSGMPTSGSVGTTLLLIGGGLFFLISGLWSWWISRELAQEYTS